MSHLPQEWQKYNAYLRFYAAIAPADAEAQWKWAQRHLAIKPEDRTPGHYYRFGDGDLIEFKPDGSGQWHPAGEIPEGFNPALVVDAPDIPVVSLREHMLAILNTALQNGADQKQITEKINAIDSLDSPERARGLMMGFKNTLAHVPPNAAAQLENLEQGAKQMVRDGLMAGNAHGRDTAGMLFINALGKQLAHADENKFLEVIAWLLLAPAGSMNELGAIMMKHCFSLGLKDQIAAALRDLESSGDAIVKQAQKGSYPDGHPEYCLEIYYGSLLQAIPYLMSAEDNYTCLKSAPGLTDDEKEIFTQREEATEERAVRLNNALLYAAQDVDQSRLNGKRAYIQYLLTQDRKKAEAYVRQTIQYEYFYPSNFESVLLGEPA